MINKRGEITTAQIVMIIVLIVSFIVILYFFYRLNFGATSNSDICHNSVVLQSKSANLAPGGLQCKTDYVCITGGGKCADMNPTITVNVDPGNKDAIMKAIADQMASCWYEFGEGKLNYGGKGPFGSGGCALCSVVEFDSSILSKNYGLTYADFYSYLNTLKKDNTQTYLTYLYGVYDIGSLQQQYPLSKDNAGLSILTAQKYAIATGYNTGLAWGVFGGNKAVPVSYLMPDQLSSELKCSNFVTQA